MLKKCICKTCGRTFNGGPRASHCPECREERRKKTYREHIRKKKLGLTRKIGSIDKCIYCGKDYIVESGPQIMCLNCKPEHYAEHNRQTAFRFYHKHKDGINRLRNESRRIGKRNCTICGNDYEARTNTITCSDECKRIRRNQVCNKRYHERKNEK